MSIILFQIFVYSTRPLPYGISLMVSFGLFLYSSPYLRPYTANAVSMISVCSWACTFEYPLAVDALG